MNNSGQTAISATSRHDVLRLLCALPALIIDKNFSRFDCLIDLYEGISMNMRYLFLLLLSSTICVAMQIPAIASSYSRW